MSDISVVIPINEINEVIEDYLNKCVQSIVNQTVKPDKVYISHADTKELNDFFKSWQKPTELEINILVNKDKTDFCSQVNYCVDNIETEWFSVLEVDDEASDEQVISAHKRLMAKNHPDKGGSTYIASQINQAKDVLLKD